MWLQTAKLMMRKGRGCGDFVAVQFFTSDSRPFFGAEEHPIK
jgi:hypothetical protein